MIYDQIENIERYVEVSDNFSTAVAYILMNDISKLPFGRTVIDEENVFVDICEIKTALSEEKLFQEHQKYITLEILLDGAEMFELALGGTKEAKPYNENNDTTALEGVASVAGLLCEDRFTAYITGEAYKSGIKAKGCKKVKKAIFKIMDDTINEEENENV